MTMRFATNRDWCRPILVAALIGLALILVSACQSTSQDRLGERVDERHVLYLVRHAEKQSGPNPSLTDAGRARAQTLADLLSKKGITHIHSTDYARTLQTAETVSSMTGVPVVLYEPDDLSGFAETLVATPGVHLVVGHSNTTPQLATALGADPGTPIDEATEYDRLYVVTLDNGEVTEGRIDRFGARYVPTD